MDLTVEILLKIGLIGCPAAFLLVCALLLDNERIKHKPYIELFIAFGLYGGSALTISMGLSFLGLFAAMLMLCAGVPAAIGSAISVVCRRNKSKYHWVILVMCILYPLSLPLSYRCWRSMASWEPNNPEKLADCWESEFGYAPPESVNNIRAKQYMIGDCGCQWLYFSANSSVAEILQQGFRHVSKEKFMREAGGANIPEWWTPEEDGVTWFYYNPSWIERYSKNEAYLAYNQDCSHVYFQSSGHD